MSEFTMNRKEAESLKAIIDSQIPSGYYTAINSSEFIATNKEDGSKYVDENCSVTLYSQKKDTRFASLAMDIIVTTFGVPQHWQALKEFIVAFNDKVDQERNITPAEKKLLDSIFRKSDNVAYASEEAVHDHYERKMIWRQDTMSYRGTCRDGRIVDVTGDEWSESIVDRTVDIADNRKIDPYNMTGQQRDEIQDQIEKELDDPDLWATLVGDNPNVTIV